LAGHGLILDGKDSMKSNRVGLKLGVAFISLIIILLGVGFLGLGRMGKMNDEIQDVVDYRWQKVKLAREALHYSDLNNRITMQLFLMEDKQKIALLMDERARNTEKISLLLKEIQRQAQTDKERALLADVWATRSPYVNSYLRALDLLLKQNKPQEARTAMVNVTLPDLLAYHQAWEAFVEFQGRQMDIEGDAAEVHYWLGRQQVLGLIGLAVALAGFIAAFVTRGMTREISNRQEAERELRKVQEGLEIRVKERTAELESAHQKLLESSRLAGMAEVASGVLHNVGNVLNSVNVSTNVIAEKINQSPVANLCKAAEMIESHRQDLASFLTSDEKGRQLPGYFSMVAKILSSENSAVLGELSTLAHGIEHIKQIVQLQQDYAKSSTMRMPVKPATLFEDALRINMLSLERHGIAIVREIADVGIADIDKHKTLQILINLISNAKNALKAAHANGNDAPKLTLRLAEVNADGKKSLQFEVIDNGIGIPPENLSRIFLHGFTTRAGGHGFGLHSAANAAREMQGNLSCSSQGNGQGATFTLDVPLISNQVMKS
jgi:signal transduction histidine kinase